MFLGFTDYEKNVTTMPHAQDPLFRGAYSYIALGSSPEDMETLGEPVGDVLFFAGEATSEKHAATVRRWVS